MDKQKLKANLKEWCRKKIVSLKRGTHIIPLLITVVGSIYFLCSLNGLSMLINDNSGMSNAGLYMFVTTLVCILVMLAMLNSFPKRKAYSLPWLIATFVMLAVMIVFDMLFYNSISSFVPKAAEQLQMSVEEFMEAEPSFGASQASLIGHVIFTGVSVVALATLPLYKAAFNKINTKKVLEESQLKEEIDTSEE